MKRILSFSIILFALVFLFTGCYENTSTDDVNTSTDTLNTFLTYGVDYCDAETFESALNDGAKVEGKTVQFYVNEYAPDSALGINCHAGEHLNFIFEDELEVESGDIIVVRISKEPSKVFLLGSWEVPCEFIKIAEKKQESEIDKEFTSEPSEEPSSEPITASATEAVTESTTEAVTESTTEAVTDQGNKAGIPDDWFNLLEKHYEEVRTLFEDAGFTYIICVAHEIDYNENNTFEGSVVNIAIGENGDVCTFEKGEQWDKEVKIRIDYRVKPAQEFPSEDTNSGSSQNQSGSGSSTGNPGVTVPTHEESKGNLVWVPTNGGTKYHSDSSCSGMINPMQISIETAKSYGYTACARCR